MPSLKNGKLYTMAAEDRYTITDYGSLLIFICTKRDWSLERAMVKLIANNRNNWQECIIGQSCNYDGKYNVASDTLNEVCINDIDIRNLIMIFASETEYRHYNKQRISSYDNLDVIVKLKSTIRHMMSKGDML